MLHWRLYHLELFPKTAQDYQWTRFKFQRKQLTRLQIFIRQIFAWLLQDQHIDSLIRLDQKVANIV